MRVIPNEFEPPRHAARRPQPAPAMSGAVLCAMLPFLLLYWCGLAMFVAARATIEGAANLVR